MSDAPRWPRFTKQAERRVEWTIPSDAADYLEPRAREALYTEPLVIEGVSIPRNSPTAFVGPPARLDRRKPRR